jgi:hypothetical protein
MSVKHFSYLTTENTEATELESTTTRKAGGLDFTAIGGKGGAPLAPIVENNAV